MVKIEKSWVHRTLYYFTYLPYLYLIDALNSVSPSSSKKCVYILHSTHRVHSRKNHFLLLPTLTQPNPTRLFTFPSSSNFPFPFFFLFSSSFIIPPFPPLPLTFTSLPLPYPIPPSLKSLPTLPCPALSRLSGIITCTQKKKKTNPQRPKKKKTICLFNLSNLASITSLSQSHIFFSGEREGRGEGGGGEEVLLYLQVPDLKDSDDDDEC